MSTFQTDKSNNAIILSSQNKQVMMEWEKPYMEASIDTLQPKGNVLEIGFGLGYSATQIMKYKPKSYTIIECEPVVIERIKEWSKHFLPIPITIVEGRWQAKNYIHWVYLMKYILMTTLLILQMNQQI